MYITMPGINILFAAFVLLSGFLRWSHSIFQAGFKHLGSNDLPAVSASQLAGTIGSHQHNSSTCSLCFFFLTLFFVVALMIKITRSPGYAWVLSKNSELVATAQVKRMVKRYINRSFTVCDF